MNVARPYGFELILDLHGCDSSTFNRDSITAYYEELCERINMELCVIHFWDDVDVPIEEQQKDAHTKGTSAVCFILTSSIVVHTLDILGCVYVNIFSCKTFNRKDAESFTNEWFKASACQTTFIERM